MESNIRILKDQQANLTKDAAKVAKGAPERKSDKVTDAEREVTNWENQLAVLRQHYKDSFPDVQNAVERLTVARKRWGRSKPRKLPTGKRKRPTVLR